MQGTRKGLSWRYPVIYNNRRLIVALLLSISLHSFVLMVPVHHRTLPVQQELKVFLPSSSKILSRHVWASTGSVLVPKRADGHIRAVKPEHTRLQPAKMKLEKAGAHKILSTKAASLKAVHSDDARTISSSVVPSVKNSEIQGIKKFNSATVSIRRVNPSGDKGNHIAPESMSPASSLSGASNQSPPRLLKPVTLRYPSRAREAGVEGTLKLELTIDTHGNVVAIRILSAKPEGYFEQSAREAFSSAHFSPALVNGKPEKCKLVQTIHYVLGFSR